MKKTQNMIGSLGAAVILLSSLNAFADGYGEREEYEGHRSLLPVNSSDLYQSECGSCHFAYQPGLLPARSWQKMMGGLDNHFGDNAELAVKSKTEILAYLQQGAADVQLHRKSAKFLRGISSDAVPLRITELPYMKRKHDEIPARFISGNPKVGSLANCVACHTQAANGNFDEDSVRIPNFGRWED